MTGTHGGTAHSGLLYRALNPRYARAPLSGEGARLHGGRFNARGTAALYLSLSPATAIREANQIGTLQPTTLVAYRAKFALLFDGRDLAALAAYEMTPDDLSDPAWRARMLEEDAVPTQILATRLVAEGFAGLLAPSQARGAGPRDVNVVLWRWNDGPGTALAVVDDEGRLKR